MKISVIAVCLMVACARLLHASESYGPPEQIFGPPTSDVIDWPEPVRQRVLAALRSDKRDVLLTGGIVPTRTVAGELWFDLRGFTVRRDELPTTAVVSRICWDNARFDNVDLSGANFSPALLRGTSFVSSRLGGANFDGDQMQGADFVGCDLHGASFRQGMVSNATRFANSDLRGAVFDHLVGAGTFTGGVAIEASFLDAGLAGARFNDVNLERSSFAGATLDRSEWFGSYVDKADFKEASLSNAYLTVAGGLPQFGRTVFYHTHLANLNFQALDVSAIVWQDEDYRIGEEIDADAMPASPVPQNRENLYRVAEAFYRSLSRKYRDLGYFDEYLALRYRACETRRKLLGLRPGRASAELVWLDIAKLWDGYGTDLPGILLALQRRRWVDSLRR